MITSPPPHHGPARPEPPASVVVTGVSATTAWGRGAEATLDAAVRGEPAFTPVRRFTVDGRRVRVAATLPGQPDLTDELTGAIDDAWHRAGLTARQRRGVALLLAVHGDPAAARTERPGTGADHLGARLAARCGFSSCRTYTTACVAASTAVADAAVMLRLGLAERIMVAAGYLVDADQFALFDAGRALAADGQLRPFSADRRGLLLGDGIAAVVLETERTACSRAAPLLARIAGWGRSGDGYHVCRPRPDGSGLARAIDAALRRGGIGPERIGYVNAHGSGTPHSDSAEASGLRLALGSWADRTPVSSTKSVHGQALEASGLVELVITMLALRRGVLPVNAGYLGPDSECALDLIVDGPRETRAEYALSVNVAFGGANTALLVGVP